MNWLACESCATIHHRTDMSAALKSVFWFGVVVSGGYVIMRAGTPEQADVLKVHADSVGVESITCVYFQVRLI